MYTHRSSCLEGPVSGAREWWREIQVPSDLGKEPVPQGEAVPAQDDDPNFRADLVARIRREIAEGTYGTPAQLEAALERMLERLEDGNP
jgi:hypothetical protein